MKEYIGYIRVSTVKQGTKGVSLNEQRDAIVRYAERHQLKITTWLEEMETAAKQGRPIFNQALKLLRTGKAQGIILHKLDRGARNLRDWAAIGELSDQGIDVHFVNESIDLQTRGGRLSADIQAVVSADYIRNLREETRKGFYGRLKQGLYPLPAPIRYYDPDVPRSIVYGLGRKGGTLLRQRFNLEVDPHSWSEQTHQVGRVYLEHALFVADVMVAVETSCRKRGDVKLIQEEDINISREKQPLPWRVTLHDGTKLGVVPDRVFALEYAGQNGQRERVFFFLEADRGTMPVKRHTLAQTSFYRKLLAYEATWSQGVHKRLGMNRIRVLTVTTSAMRVKSLAQAASSLERGHGLFLFADKSILSGDILSSLWQTAKPGEPRRLL